VCENIGKGFNLAKLITIKPAPERYPEYFAIIDNVIDKLVEWIDVDGMRPHKSALDFVKTATIVRAFNLYKSINLLLRSDHWEDAAVIARSLFELLLNLEEILREKAVSEWKASKYLRFWQLQESLHIVNDIEYEIATGRCSKERALLLKKLKQSMETLFKEFRKKKSPTGWENTWCGKSIYKLASISINQMRIYHYKIVYSHFSELSHSSPYSAMTTWTEMKPGDNVDLIVQRREDIEKQNLVTVLLLSTSWLMEILLLANSQILSYNGMWNLEILKRIYEAMGLNPPINLGE
jgi:hypothetical protein